MQGRKERAGRPASATASWRVSSRSCRVMAENEKVPSTFSLPSASPNFLTTSLSRPITSRPLRCRCTLYLVVRSVPRLLTSVARSHYSSYDIVSFQYLTTPQSFCLSHSRQPEWLHWCPPARPAILDAPPPPSRCSMTARMKTQHRLPK